MGRGDNPYQAVRLYMRARQQALLSGTDAMNISFQKLYDLSDMATVTEVIYSRSFLEFCGLDSSDQMPDDDTLGRFRNLLVRNSLHEKLFAQVIFLLMELGLILKKKGKVA